MPKTTVNKNDQPAFTKSEIRFSKQRNVPAPTANFVLTEKPNQNKFRVFVSASTDERHHGGAFFLCPNIGHKCSRRGSVQSIFTPEE
jgi:hypothetical protein